MKITDNPIYEYSAFEEFSNSCPLISIKKFRKLNFHAININLKKIPYTDLIKETFSSAGERLAKNEINTISIE